jgi:predicted nucleotidyltransferase
MSEMRRFPLFGKTRQEVLRLVFSGSDKSFHFRDIVRRTSCAVGGVHSELALLVEQGILIREKIGNSVFYKANKKSPIYFDLRNLIMKTVGEAAVIGDALSSVQGRIQVAFIFGSLATGDDDCRSDIDLMIIGDISLIEAAEALEKAQNYLGRVINLSVYKPSEFTERLLVKNNFLVDVMRKPKIFLLGDEDELGESEK